MKSVIRVIRSTARAVSRFLLAVLGVVVSIATGDSSAMDMARDDPKSQSQRKK